MLPQELHSAAAVVGWLRAVTGPTAPAEVAAVIARQMASWIPGAAIAVVRLTPDAADVLASPGVPDEWLETVRHAARDVAADDGEARRRGPTVLTPAVPDGRILTALTLPLECRGLLIGAVVALDDGPSAAQRFQDPSVAALCLPLEIAGTALDNALRLDRAEQLSVTDDLTQLYNSRFLNQALHRETKRAVRARRPLALVFVDLDGFKSINDAHGHLFGSRALIEAAHVIRSSARETDVVARFGGDEFALILPDTACEGAVAVGARVREHIAAHRFLEVDGLDIHLSASVGIATLPDVADTAEGLLHAADRAMYWVKDHGKNGIRAADAATPVRTVD